MYRIILLCFCFYIVNAGHAQKNPSSPDFLNETAPQYQTLQVKLGFNLGWSFPYSAGMETSFLIHELVDINLGAGVGISGWKIGVGSRVYPLRKNKVSPMIGLYLFHATGLQELNVSTNMEEATFRITPDEAILMNGGMRLRFGRGHYFTAAAGYVFPFEGEQAVHLYGSRNESLQNMANALATSGFSFHVGILLKLSGGNYLK